MLFKKKENKKVMKLEEVTKLLDKLKLPMQLVFTPVNLQDEKKKFISSDDYNPNFKYKSVKNNNSKILAELESLTEISDVDPRISDFYIKLIKSKKESSDLMHAVGNNELVTSISKKRYGVPAPALFRNACRVTRGMTSIYNLMPDQKKSEAERLIFFDEMESIFDKFFHELGLDEWKLIKSRNIQKGGVRIGMKAKQIAVDPDIKKSPIDLRKTIVHEVGTHLFRGVNGFTTGFDALGKANLPEYLDVEEGLATWNEEKMGLLQEKHLRGRALQLYAVRVGETLSFRELYEVLLIITNRGTAFDTALRVKRGLSDTSKPGIYTKDLAYFKGYRKVRRKLESDPSLYNKLYAGKISFDQIEWVDDGLLPKPKYILDRGQFESLFEKVGI